MIVTRRNGYYSLRLFRTLTEVNQALDDGAVVIVIEVSAVASKNIQ